jgi:hypothetical protein
LGVGCRRFESYYPDGVLYFALYRFPIFEFEGLFIKLLRLVKKQLTMALNDFFDNLRIKTFYSIRDLVKSTAELLGYPDNMGMPIIQRDGEVTRDFHRQLPVHRGSFPPPPSPKNIYEAFLGHKPIFEPVDRNFFEHSYHGFYNFFIVNYKNIFFFPDALSEFIQIRLNICLDITTLETGREVLFLAICLYFNLYAWRIALYWYIFINPYVRPWSYYISLTDWTQEGLAGFSPVIVGIDIMPSLFLGLIGKLADSISHLVFTMPYLPSEGQSVKVVLEQTGTKGPIDILLFQDLPVLWYKYPIPNNIREFWYTERPDILRYMKKYYSNLNLEIYPDRILKAQKLETLSTSALGHQSNSLLINYNEQLIINTQNFNSELNVYLSHHQDDAINFFSTSIDKITALL